MPDFTVRLTAGATLADWTDPIGPEGQPSRLNPREGFPHRRWIGTVGVPIVFRAEVDGALGPPDSALEGRLFGWWLVECPVPPIALLTDPRRSSVQRFTPRFVGHHTIGVRRDGGGLVHVHVDVGPAP